MASPSKLRRAGKNAADVYLTCLTSARAPVESAPRQDTRTTQPPSPQNIISNLLFFFLSSESCLAARKMLTAQRSPPPIRGSEDSLVGV